MVNLVLFALKFVFIILFYLLVILVVRGIYKDTFVSTKKKVKEVGKLQLLNPQGNIIKEVAVSKDAVIGRSEKVDLTIEDDFSSYSHAKVFIQGNDFVLKDLKSTNGTYLNSKKVSKETLNDGDIIAIGKTKIKFVK